MPLVDAPRLAPPLDPPAVELASLDTVWFQVAGTLCNLACRHCLVSSSPSNRTHEPMTLAEIEPHLEEAVRLGAREYYFTGGEPFANPEMEAIVARTLEVGPVTVLTNGLLLDEARCARLAGLAARSDYSLDLRVSLDGWDATSHDAIRGPGAYEAALGGIARLVQVGLEPVITVTEVDLELPAAEARERFLTLLRELGIAKPRLKFLPLFRIGAEAERSAPYPAWARLRAAETPAAGWTHLQCNSSRMVTDQGVWVCPILVNEPSARMGERLADTLRSFPLSHPACWTCHVSGVSCRT
jgi:MoaA/NifB/PqqE/SkfB family radical SAM enzyme